MGRIGSFLFGVVVGAAGLYGALNYHWVRADDGLHVVPKIASGLGEIYIDIREFELSDWHEHKSLAAAIVRAEKTELLNDVATDSLRNSLDSAIQTLSRS